MLFKLRTVVVPSTLPTGAKVVQKRRLRSMY